MSERDNGEDFNSALSFSAWDGSSAGESAPEAEDATSAEAAHEAAASAREFADLPANPDASQADASKAPGSMSLMEHLNELRSRLIRILLVLLAGFFACWGFAETLFAEISAPLTAALPPGSKLVFTALPEAFFVYIKVGFTASLFLTSPYIFYQIWAFVAPGLYEEERRFIVPPAACSAFFFLAGAVFCYHFVFPAGFVFFLSYTTEHIVPMLSLDEYLSLALKLLIAFGLVFEMPLFAFFLARMGIITAQRLRAWRRYAVLAIFIAAAVLTPPDVFSQLLLATPMLLLYELSIWVAAAVYRPKSAKTETA